MRVVKSKYLNDRGIEKVFAFDDARIVTSAIAISREVATAAGISPCKWRQTGRLLVYMCVIVGSILLASQRCLAGADPLQTLPVTHYADGNSGRPLTIGFYVNWDFSSYVSLKNNIASLDWVVPSWLYLRGKEMEMKTSLDVEALDLIRLEKPGVAIHAMIQNASAGEWDGINLGRFLANSAARRERIKDIAAFVERYHLQGIVIDFESIPSDAQKDMIDFLREVHATFKDKGWLVSVAVPFDDPSYDYAAYAEACDYLILMAYDEHWLTGEPGPIASHAWFSSRLATRMRDISPSKVIVAIANYGYDWTRGEKAAQALTYPEAMRRAIETGATPELDPSSLNSGFSYNRDGKTHRVWFLDAHSAYRELQSADPYRPAGYALWRLGSEDPLIWSILPHRFDNLPALSSINR